MLWYQLFENINLTIQSHLFYEHHCMIQWFQSLQLVYLEVPLTFVLCQTFSSTAQVYLWLTKWAQSHYHISLTWTSKTATKYTSKCHANTFTWTGIRVRQENCWDSNQTDFNGLRNSKVWLLNKKSTSEK